MTTIEIKPTRRPQYWSLQDSSTCLDYLPGAQVYPFGILTRTTGITGLSVGREPGIPTDRKPALFDANWFTPTLQAMAALLWSSEDRAAGATPTRFAAADQMMTILSLVLDHRTPPPSVVPTWDGGVQVEWHRNGVDLEIEVGPLGEVEYFFKSPNLECEGQAWEDLESLTGYAQTVV